MQIPILYEDDVLLVINKPPGLVVNRADSVVGETLQDWIEKKFSILNSSFENTQDRQFSNEEKDFYKRAGIVHRLDKDTSGCLLIAKNEETFLALQTQFHDRVVSKTYQALVHGRVMPSEGMVNAPVGRLPWNRSRFGVFPEGRPAETQYRVISYYQKDGEEFSLLNFFPKTGRTHQIRVHAKYMEHPLVADMFYAGEKIAKNDLIWCPRIFLHAATLIFVHPKTGKQMTVEAPIPEDLEKALESLELRD